MSTKPPPIEIDGAEFLAELNAAHARGYLEAKAGKKMSVLPESPAKEQPGEQNAAPSETGKGQDASASQSSIPDGSGPKVAAPDIAAMVKRLEQFAFHLRTIENQYAETMREKIDRDAAELMEQAAAMKLGQGWIPVSKILPPVGEIVAVLLSDRRPWAGWHKGGNDWSINDSTVDVTHWMPLPPPPERP